MQAGVIFLFMIHNLSRILKLCCEIHKAPLKRRFLFYEECKRLLLFRKKRCQKSFQLELACKGGRRKKSLMTFNGYHSAPCRISLDILAERLIGKQSVFEDPALGVRQRILGVNTDVGNGVIHVIAGGA